MIKQAIQDQIKQAMRDKNALALDALRYILSQIKYVEIAKHEELTDAGVLDVLNSEVKKRRDAIKIFKDSGRDQMVIEEESKLATILALMPAQLTRQEIEVLVDKAIASVGKDNMGLLMRELMPAVKGKADGGLVSQIVKEKISL